MQCNSLLLHATANGPYGILDAMMDMVRVLDRNCNVTYINNSYINHFGNLRGLPCNAMFRSEKDCGGCPACWAKTHQESVEKYQRIGDRTYWIVASPTFSETYEVTGAVEVFRDVTEQQNQARRVELQNRRLLNDAMLASKTQRMLLSRMLPSNDYVRCFGRSRPRQTIGGDIFGALENGGRLGFFIADVAGHGVAAAVVAVMLVQIIKTNLALVVPGTPRNVLKEIVRQWAALELDESIYATIFLGFLDSQSGRLVYVNGGYTTSPLLYDGSNVQRLCGSGMPISRWIDDPDYKEHTADLARGGRLLLYSDGFMDPRNPFITETELTEIIKTPQPDEVIDQLFSSAPDEPPDDLTALLIERKA